ncbi:MAG: hypothetical protein GWP07_04255 [Xanthomonadaceae bacterium]|nr:hypothetical protein [Xanthomonadaceae bacterium]
MLVVIFLHFFPQNALAILVTYAGSESITISGQLFTWDKVVDTSAGIGELVIEAAGDFNYSGSENSSVYLDDVFSEEGLGLSNADFIQESTLDGHYWNKRFTLSSTSMSMLTSDNMIAVQIVNSTSVDPIWDTGIDLSQCAPSLGLQLINMVITLSATFIHCESSS